MIADFFIKLVNLIISGIGFLGSSVFNLLPSSPFLDLDLRLIPDNLLNNLSWIIPFNTIITILNSSLLVVGLYYLYQIILRWVKAIE